MTMTQISPITLPLERAHTATSAAVEHARGIGIPYTLTVVDGAGMLVHLTRMDGAALASIDTSIAKARTAVYFGSATVDLAPAIADHAPLASIQTSVTLPLAFVAGAVPITDAAGVVIGAFGAGGGSPEQDHAVAAAAVAALEA
jgi:uncharacterized protein GlcG (DUF336 family)